MGIFERHCGICHFWQKEKHNKVLLFLGKNFIVELVCGAIFGLVLIEPCFVLYVEIFYG